jgi:hypothetical protein
MTLLDAPAFDAARARRNQTILFGAAGLFVVLFIVSWFVAGRPVDWPWNWWTHYRGRTTVNKFLDAVEQNDLSKAYGIWFHDPDWRQHPNKYGAYSFDRFEQDWSPTSSGNDYGAIRSHKIEAARISGNVLIVGSSINGLKSKALFLDYDPQMHTLGFSPVELYLGP